MAILKRIIKRSNTPAKTVEPQAHPNFWMYQ
ncbi:hypothetical protein SAMN05216271_0323 [Halopseudomonas sabulinigri]|uniref:Uncharacterized protein n=1 Tax=Halopseudomonas sabulinigri TaxID=472181 RepID=A0A1H1LRX9_9GAMM|nr:hypothetical protein SAMN05216271_0323 [Halopseudomonas sabulinigri]